MSATLTKKAREGDVVELVDDEPEYNLVRGQRAVVINEFDEPSEAYDLAAEDKDGNFLGFAYSVRPEQIINRTREAFELGMQFIESGELVKAERQLEEAVNLTPGYRGVILSSILESYVQKEDWESMAALLRLLLRIAPSYGAARENLAIAYTNLGVEKAKVGNIAESQVLYSHAINLNSDEKIVSQIQENFAANFTALGAQEHTNGDHEKTMEFMKMACICHPDDTTRRNLGVARAYMARSYMRQNKHEAAVAVFQSAEEAGLLSAELLNDQAVSMVFIGQADEAARVFERALRLEPENKIIKENIAKLARHEDSKNYIVEEFQPEYLPMPAVTPQSFALADAA